LFLTGASELALDWADTIGRRLAESAISGVRTDGIADAAGMDEASAGEPKASVACKGKSASRT
jgi:hypothetical protein